MELPTVEMGKIKGRTGVGGDSVKDMQYLRCPTHNPLQMLNIWLDMRLELERVVGACSINLGVISIHSVTENRMDEITQGEDQTRKL